jgi:hypothetical protein
MRGITGSKVLNLIEDGSRILVEKALAVLWEKGKTLCFC